MRAERIELQRPPEVLLGTCIVARAGQQPGQSDVRRGIAVVEIERVRSIDEFQARLSAADRELDRAIRKAREVKNRIRVEAGPLIGCSIGLGPNHLLAKIAGKLEKPDGLSWLSPGNMPDGIADMPLDKLPGIAKGVRRKLEAAGVRTIPELHRLDPRHARLI